MKQKRRTDQKAAFRRAARELETSESEAAFNSVLKTIGRQRPKHDISKEIDADLLGQKDPNQK